jgi:VWFA-related protein
MGSLIHKVRFHRSRFRSSSLWATVLVGTIFIGSAAAFGQVNAFGNPPEPNNIPHDSSPIDLRNLTTIHVNAEEVDVLFAALDKHHRPVGRLTQEDIAVLDNGRVPQRILQFRRRTDMPLRIGLIIDISESISTNFGNEKHAAIKFLKKVMEPDKDSTFVISFNQEAKLLQEPTSDVEALNAAVKNLKKTGETSFYDALYLGCRQLLQDETDTLRRVLIVMSDGRDNHSRHKPREVVELASRANAFIVMIDTSVFWNPNGEEERESRELVEATGGWVLRMHDNEDIVALFKKLDGELRSQYLLAFKPSEIVQPGSWRALRLSTSLKGVYLHYRAGYYSATPKQQAAMR